MMPRVTILAACVLAAFAGTAQAREYAKGTVYMESRDVASGTVNPVLPGAGASGGAAGCYVADGVAVEAEGQGPAAKRADKTRPAPGAAVQDDADSPSSVAAMARWNFVRTPTGTLYMGAGGGGVFADKPLPSTGERQSGMSQADLGGSVDLSRNVSLKAAGRFQHMGTFSGDGAGNVGANVGLKISF